MQTQAISRHTPKAPVAPAAPRASGVRHFNPTSFKNDFLDLVKVNPGLAADTATKIAEQRSLANRELNAASDNTADFVAFLLSTGIVALVGAWDGSIQAKRNAIISGWESAQLVQVGEEPPGSMWKEQGVKDPADLLGVSFLPYAFLTPVLLGTLAVATAAMRDEGDPAPWYERTLAVSAVSTFGLWIAGMTRKFGYHWQEKRMSAAPAAAA
jgi:hypothetical protein